MNPFLVLDVAVDASDDEVRAAYQSLLRRYPPEHHPEQFQLIQEAYQSLRTVRDRWRWRLLHLESCDDGPLGALERFARLPGRLVPPGAPAFKRLLCACAAAAQREQSTCRPS